MAILKATVRFRNKSGLYPVYIRFTQVKQVSYVKTSWMVNDKGVNERKEIIDPFVIKQTSLLIENYYTQLNQVDSSNWSVGEIVKYVTEFNTDMSFSEYAKNHIWKLIDRGQERTSRNYKWALQHMERFAGTDNIMFSRLTSSFLNQWIESLSTTTRSKEQYPVCMREVYKAAIREFNDEERGIVKLKNPWKNVRIPKSDVPEKRAIPASKLRAFFNVVPDRSRFTNPLMEVGQDVALISFCMCGLNAVDIFNAKKDQYNNGIFHYERQKTRSVRSDPFASLDIRERVSKAESNIVALTKEEVMSLASVETGSPATKQCYMFCCFTGLRHSDISNLKWKDIRQTDAGLAIYLPRMQKTKHPILIPLGKKALEWLPDKEDKSEDSLVFNTPQICNCDRALKHMAKRAGITKVLGFHTSRHTFGTLAILAGCDILTVSKLLGHKSVKTTQIYASVAMQMRADAVKRVEKVFGN